MKIIKTPDCSHKNHRGDFETCPDCNFKYDWEEWLKDATIFGYGIIDGCHSAGVIVTPCKKCNFLSWTHIQLQGIEYSGIFGGNKKLITAAKKELARRKLESLREWGQGICYRCKKLEGGEVTTHAWRHCADGSWGPPEQKCDKFEEID